MTAQMGRQWFTALLAGKNIGRQSQIGFLRGRLRGRLLRAWLPSLGHRSKLYGGSRPLARPVRLFALATPWLGANDWDFCAHRAGTYVLLAAHRTRERTRPAR